MKESLIIFIRFKRLMKSVFQLKRVKYYKFTSLEITGGLENVLFSSQPTTQFCRIKGYGGAEVTHHQTNEANKYNKLYIILLGLIRESESV